METVKIQNTKTGVIKEVNKSVAGDFLGTKEWKSFKDTPRKSFIMKEEKEEK